MFFKEASSRVVAGLAVAGVVVAVLSALEPRVEWLAALCAYFGSGCMETADYTLLGIPVAYWGIGYFTLLLVLVFAARRWVFWWVMAGFGVELVFVWTMISIRAVCFFCILNFLVVLALFLVCLEKERIWQAVAVSLLAFLPFHYLLSLENPMGSLLRASASEPTVAARIGEEAITEAEVVRPMSTRIYNMKKDIYQMKRKRLEDMVNGAVLRREAEARDTTVQELVDSVLAEGVEVTDQEVERYYRRNRKRWKDWKGSQEELKHRIRSYLRNVEAGEKVAEYARSLRDEYDVEILLEEPPLPFTQVSVGDSPTWGASDAPVTVVEFSDYLCPACRMAHGITKKIKEKYEGQIQWVFKDFPLERHKGAKHLALAARCAQEQGAFWDYQDLLFESEGKPDDAKLMSYAGRLDLDTEQFRQCLESEKYLSEVEEDIQEAREAGVAATPTFIVNGRLNPGVPSQERFENMIQEELEAAQGG